MNNTRLSEALDCVEGKCDCVRVESHAYKRYEFCATEIAKAYRALESENQAKDETIAGLKKIVLRHQDKQKELEMLYAQAQAGLGLKDEKIKTLKNYMTRCQHAIQNPPCDHCKTAHEILNPSCCSIVEGNLAASNLEAEKLRGPASWANPRDKNSGSVRIISELKNEIKVLDAQIAEKDKAIRSVMKRNDGRLHCGHFPPDIQWCKWCLLNDSLGSTGQDHLEKQRALNGLFVAVKYCYGQVHPDYASGQRAGQAVKDAMEAVEKLNAGG